MTEYRMDADHPGLALDRGVQGVIGKPLDRIDGVAKVTGTARYGYEHRVVGEALYGVAITATFAKGKVLAIDTDAARALPGVVDVIVDDPRIMRQAAAFSPAATGSDAIDHWGQVVGVAVAENWEAARAAAQAVRVEVQPEPGCFDTLAERDAAHGPPKSARLQDAAKGDIDAAMAEAEVTLDVTYSTPNQVHAAIEPHASVASWEEGRLTLHSSLQILSGAQKILAKVIGIEPEQVRILSPFIGGGFGGKGGIGADAILAAVASQKLGRPVKVAMTRQQLFHNVYRRTDTHQRIRLAAGRDGRLTGLAHDSLMSEGPGGAMMEPVALGSVSMYAAPNRHFSHRIATLDMVMAGAVRAPGEAVGTLGLEAAMDEMAEKLGLDPIEFRKRNEPNADPMTGAPFSTRRLVECLDEGAARFGWSERRAPASRREGDWWIGMGMAAAVRINLLVESEARVRLGPDGRATVETDMTDIGTGSYTILAQIAGEALGLPIECVHVSLGDTDHPTGAGSGGSFGAASAGSSVALACEDIVATLAERMGASPEDMTVKDGHAIAGNRRVPLAELVGSTPIEALGKIMPGQASKAYSQAAHGAQFAEVAVHAVTGETRVRRMLGVFEAGRILNAKTARSQAIGGMIWGIGYALMEEALLDTRHGGFVNDDLAEYHVPSNADVPHLDVHFIEDPDHHANPIGVKGLGELSISGAGAAVANAIYNACGVRVRDYPITLDKLLPGLPDDMRN